jgi:hypothetical protein
MSKLLKSWVTGNDKNDSITLSLKYRREDSTMPGLEPGSVVDSLRIERIDFPSRDKQEGDVTTFMVRGLDIEDLEQIRNAIFEFSLKIK